MPPHSGQLNLVQVNAEVFGTKKCVHYNNFCENKLYFKINVAESDNSLHLNLIFYILLHANEQHTPNGFPFRKISHVNKHFTFLI